MKDGKMKGPRGPAPKERDIKKANKNISLHNCFWDVVLEHGEKTGEKWSPYVALAVMEKYQRELYGTQKKGQSKLCDKLCDELL
jgi:hypothetical protein